MGYPVTVLAPEGEQYSDYASTDQRWPLGAQMMFQDGRKYRFASVGGSTLTVGDLLQGAAGVAADRVQTGVANAIGVRSPVVTATNPTAKNLYAEGYLNIDTTPGGGVSPMSQWRTRPYVGSLVARPSAFQKQLGVNLL